VFEFPGQIVRVTLAASKAADGVPGSVGSGTTGESTVALRPTLLAIERVVLDSRGSVRFGRQAGSGIQISFATATLESGATGIRKHRMSAAPMPALSARAATAAPGRRGIHARGSNASSRPLNRRASRANGR